MKFKHLAAALLLATPGLALAQNVSFSDIGGGPMGGYGAPRNVVARSQAELQAAGLEQLLNPQAHPIDWQSEMVIGVFMGTQSTGGYGIQIESIERRELPHIMIYPPPPIVHELVVNYRERRPAPGSIVTMALTAPYHLVRLARHTDTVRFERIPDAPPAVFERGYLSYDTSPIGGQGTGIMIEVAKSGAVSASRYAPAALYAPVNGQATAAELARLTAAIEGARAGSLPGSIDPGAAFFVQPPGFELAVFSGRPELNGHTSGVLGFYNTYEARVRPLVEAYRAIGDRLLNATPGLEISGRIEVGPSGVLLVDENGGARYRVRPQDKADELAQHRGRVVRVRGALQSAGPGMQVIVSDVLSPEHRPLDGIVRRVGGRYELFLGSPFQTAPLQQIATFGPASSALRLAEDRLVHCDAYVFTNPDGTPREARLDSIEGTMRRRSAVYQNGQFVGFAAKNEGVHVLSSAAWGRLARIKCGAGIGYVNADRVEVGTALTPPTPGPVPLVTASTGLAGALPGQ